MIDLNSDFICMFCNESVAMNDYSHPCFISPQMGGLMSKEDARRMFLGSGLCTPSRNNTLTGYNVTEEFKQLEKVEVYESAS